MSTDQSVRRSIARKFAAHHVAPEGRGRSHRALRRQVGTQRRGETAMVGLDRHDELHPVMGGPMWSACPIGRRLLDPDSKYRGTIWIGRFLSNDYNAL